MSLEFTPEQIKFIMKETRAAIDKRIAAQTASAKGRVTGTSGGTGAVMAEVAASPGCWACEIGLNVACGTVIAGVVVATGGAAAAAVAAAVPAIVAATGLAEATVAGILTSLAGGGAAGVGSAVEMAISELCKAMGACS